jgi:hypothetical protein
LKRIILILTVAAMMVAMTLGFAGSAVAQAQDADTLMESMGFFEDPNAPGCWFAFDAMYLCTAT